MFENWSNDNKDIQDLKLYFKKQTSKTNKQKQNNYCNTDNEKKIMTFA